MRWQPATVPESTSRQPNRTKRRVCLNRTGWPTGTVLVVAVLLCLALAPTGPAAAGSFVVLTADRQFKLAGDLFTQTHYEAAIVEYRRFIGLFPDDPRVAAARLQIGKAHAGLNHHQKAVATLQRFITDFDQSAASVDAYFIVARSYVALGRPGAARLTLQNLLQWTTDPQTRARAGYQIGWLHLDQGEFTKARSAFESIAASDRQRLRVDTLLNQLDQADRLPRKSPALAGALSLLPGAGQAYCQRYQDSLVAFAINAGLIFAAYEAFENDLPVLGSVIGVVELGFYTGNIYSAVSSAHKYNRLQQRNFIDRLKQNAGLKLSLRPHTQAATVTLNLRF